MFTNKSLVSLLDYTNKMAIWHWVVGIGLSVVVALVTQYRALPSSHSSKCGNDTYVEPLDDICAICRDLMRNEDAQYLHCGHAYHSDCVKQLRRYRTECPKCRTQIPR